MKINFDKYFGFIFGIGYKDENSKKNDKYSDESIAIFFPFVGIIIEWKRKYNKK